jgi:hypothetical protein
VRNARSPRLRYLIFQGAGRRINRPSPVAFRDILSRKREK